jgi:hypothetical protein
MGDFIEDPGRHCILMSQPDFECNSYSKSRSDISTADLVRELAGREDIESIGVKKYAEINYDSIFEYDEDGNSYICDHFTHPVNCPATILVIPKVDGG